MCEDDYDDLIEAIKSYGTYAHITESTWFIKTNKSCTDVRDELMEIINNDDRLFVAELNGTAVWNNVICKSGF